MHSALRFRAARGRAALGLAWVALAPLAAAPPPTELPELRPPPEYFPGAAHDPAVPAPEAVLGFKVGQRAATPAEIERCLRAWTAAAPDRTRLVEYARSHEGRPLHYVVVTAPQHLARLDQIQADLARFADPRQTSDAEAEKLLDTLRAVAWLAYTIHGDETEGSDAALAVLYHLIAGTDPDVARLREDLVIIVDPLMNPDGRERFVKMIAEHRGAQPNVDDQALVHDGYWPYGRGNHYLFDLNRDWLWAVHPESRGRLREVARWNPVLFVDAHGMGSQDTHLFSPPREPINPHIPASRARWCELFARDQAAAFDRHGLVYYTGEWHEEWYPGYSDAYVSYRGAVGILYEQARIAEDGVRRPEGRILSYGESVQHHVIGSLANLRTARAHARDLLRELRANRLRALDPAGPYAHRTFAVLPNTNASRLRVLTELLQLHGLELYRAARPFTAAAATNHLGQLVTAPNLPAGTLLIPNRQPLGHLVAAALEFDPRLSDQALREERRDLLRTGRSRLYDTTAWNLTMFFGLDALALAGDLPPGAEPYREPEPAPAPAAAPAQPVAYVFDGADDLSVPAAARLLERGVQVRVADKDFVLDQTPFARGSVVVTRLDNRTFAGDLAATVDRTANELGLGAVAVTSGLGAGDLPDLGGRHFRRLEPPRIGLLGRGRFDFTDFGSLWHTLDQRLGIRHSTLEDGAALDLARYNVLILPHAWSGTNLLSRDALKEWVRGGGTLIAIGSSVGPYIAEAAAFSKVRRLPDVLGRLAEYELAILREWLARDLRAHHVPPEQLWTHQPTPGLRYPWQAAGGAHPEEKELKRRDAWQDLFMPQGALLAGRVDTNHWLTFGCPEPIPLLADRRSVLMAAGDVEAPIRYGYLVATNAPTNSPSGGAQASVPEVQASGSVVQASGSVVQASGSEVQASGLPSSGQQVAANSTGTSEISGPAGAPAGASKDKPEPPRIGWAATPPGTTLYLRMSGLLWPEAAHRIAHTAWVTRESYGRGQIILFATPPTFRGSIRATMRVFLNAAVYGPGLGANHPLRP